MDFGKPQSGRTTRMLEAAMQEIQRGKQVFIVMANQPEVTRVRNILVREHGLSPYVFKIGTAQSLNLDWKTRKLVYYKNASVFIDHYAIQTYLQDLMPIVNEMHKYDLPITTITGRSKDNAKS